MTLVRHRLGLLALGFLGPVLALGTIALSGSPPAAAFDETPYVPQGWSCEPAEGYWTTCDGVTGYCTTTAQMYCDGGYVTLQWLYPYESSDEYQNELDPCAHPDVYPGLICP